MSNIKCTIFRTYLIHLSLLLALLMGGGPLFAAPKKTKDDGLLRFRIRTVKLTPSQPAMIHWTYGGRGLSGDPVSGVITQEKPAPLAVGSVDDDLGMDFSLEEGPADRVIVKGDTFDVHYLNPGVWWHSRPLRELPSQMMTLLITGHETGSNVTDCQLEVEVSYDGKVIKTFTIDGDGPILGMIIPYRALDENGAPTDAFIKGLGSLLNHAKNKQELLQAEPWFDWPTPELTGVISDASGNGRTTDMQTILAEVEVMRMMGMNGFRGVDAEVAEMVRSGEGIGAHFNRTRLVATGGGFPIPTIDVGDGRAPFRHKGDGCPYLPANRTGIDASAKATADRFFEQALQSGAQDVWGLTIDEIGNVFGGANEGGNHPGSCSYCSEAFREMIRADGLTPEDFGATSWEDIRPVQGYWAIDYWESLRILKQRVAEAQKAMIEATQKAPLGLGEGLDDFSLEEKEPVDHSALLVAARERLKALEWSSKILFVPEEERKLNVSDEGWHLMQYYSRRFMERTSGMMFNPLRVLLQEKNREKADAIARGDLDSPAAKQPWLFAYGLRQPRFTWGGGSLGMFEYYRYADTAFVYETSNRDGRVHQWDSYMNDVGRSMTRFCGVDFGVYVKPHRGAAVQRALSAAVRGNKLLYWYTYGPEWKKGDSFGGSSRIRSEVAYGNRLVAAAEDVFVGGEWSEPAKVAIVRPRTAEFFSGNASWENGKWVYMALAHAHIPMDPIDEMLIETMDLSQYKVIVISGAHLRRKSAQRIKQWVGDGGTLYTCGYGMAKDEAGRPLKMLHEMFGVTDRISEMPEWGSVRRYGATSLAPITPKEDAPTDYRVTGTNMLEGAHQPMVGCEVLQPASGAQVLATNSAGEAVAVSNNFGKGKAYLIGTYAGMEYAHDAMQRQPYDAAKRSWIAAPVLAAGVTPVVKVSDAMVEGVLIENDPSGKQALTLLNWHWNREHATLENITVTFRTFGERRKVRSVALQQDLPVTVDGEWMSVTLPTLGDADVLLVE